MSERERKFDHCSDRERVEEELREDIRKMETGERLTEIIKAEYALAKLQREEPNSHSLGCLEGQLRSAADKLVNYATHGRDLITDEKLAMAKVLVRAADRIKQAERSVRVEKATFPDGEIGCRFIVGEDHVVAEWRGNGVYADTVFSEDTALAYFKTTTSFDRCVRMVLEMVHWELASAMLAGPGDGKLVDMATSRHVLSNVGREWDGDGR